MKNSWHFLTATLLALGAVAAVSLSGMLPDGWRIALIIAAVLAIATAGALLALGLKNRQRLQLNAPRSSLHVS